MSMLCPRCGVMLNEVRKVGVLVDVCDQCRGMWLDRGEMEKIVHELREFEREEGRFECRPDERPYRGAERLGGSATTTTITGAPILLEHLA